MSQDSRCKHIPIAVVAMAGRFPGADNIDAFWELISQGKDAHSSICEHKLGAPVKQFLGAKGSRDRFYCDQGGFIRDFTFTPEGFAKSTAEMRALADTVDEHQLWALDVAKTALLGIAKIPERSRCGVVMGTLSFPTQASNRAFLPLYHHAVEQGLQARLPGFPKLNPFDGRTRLDGTDAKVPGWRQHTAADASGLIAECLGLGGPELSLDAACASSVYAIKLACDYLACNKADLMLAGAVSGADPFFVSMGFSIFQAFPSQGTSAPLDKSSGGLFAGEGAGMLALKRLDDALRDGDRIQGVIRSVGLSNDGRGQFVLSPSSKGQIKALERAYDEAGIDPAAVEVLECHATGTPLGDKVELESLERFFEDRLKGESPPLIGSVKSNLTHLLTAAGMPGIIKLMLAMKHKLVPATVRLSAPITSPKGLFGAHQIVNSLRPWPSKVVNPAPIAGLSVFGFGGCNAHLLLESPEHARALAEKARAPYTGNDNGTCASFAIEGVASHFGRASSLRKLAGLIERNESALTALPANRWKGMQHLFGNKTTDETNSNSAPPGGYLKGFELDFMRFRLPPHPDERLLPQQLLLMKVADEAIRDAGLNPGSKVAVLVAMETELELHQFRGRVNLHSQIAASLESAGISLTAEEHEALCALVMDSLLPPASLNQYTSYIGNIMASRVASQWDFHGPAFTLSGAELSVARTLEVAHNLFATQSLDAIVVAAVDLAGCLEKVFHHAEALGALNLAPGEGAGALVLRLGNAGRYGNLQAPSFFPVANAPSDHIDEHSPCIRVGRLMEASRHSASARLGHSFAAAGMASLLHGLLKLSLQQYGPADQAGDRTDQHARLLMDGERACALMSLSQDQVQRLALLTRIQEGVPETDSALFKGKPLMRRIVLGGPDIVKHILSAPLPKEADIRAKLGGKNQATDMNTANMNTHDSMVIASSRDTVASVSANRELALAAHQAFLQSRQLGLRLAQALASRMSESGPHAPTTGQHPSAATPLTSEASPQPSLVQQPMSPIPRHAGAALQTTEMPCIWNYQDLVQYAEGDIAPVFGPEYAIIDSYRRRVRLPTTDYLLVSRVTKLDARLNEYKPSTMTTEYDIPLDAPYLVDGQIPWAVAVESGQCDLMLISFLGIDLENRGERVYRLLDCTLTFLDDLPRGGDTLRYDISINSFAKNGDTLLFFFSYQCFVSERLILKMDGGCAGFFTDEELADGKGVIRTQAEIRRRQQAINSPRHFAPLIPCGASAFSYDRVSRLLAADVAGCFGPSHELGYRQPSLCFASEKFLMIEEVSKVEPNGGAWGLGLIEGHKQLEPEHWYFPCHFKDDPVMAGSLMAEGCGQLLQFYMLYLGLHQCTRNGRFQPLKDAPQQVRCRGQVLPQSNRLSYRMEVTDIGLSPSPWAKANIEIILDGKVVVDFQNLGVMLKEEEHCRRYQGIDQQPHNRLQPADTPQNAGNGAVQEGRQASPNAPLMTHETDVSARPIHGVQPVKHQPAPLTPDYPNRQPDTVPFTPWHLFEFATGNIENCFGSAFAVYRGLIPPRTPCGDLQLTTRVVEVEGIRGDFKSPASCVGEYEVPPNAWYFSENNHPARMPYAILMEIALQPNGFISGYMGTTLGFPGTELFFRNLDGEGRLLKDIDLRGKTISNDSRLLSTVMAGTDIIQSFSFALAADGEPFYEGKAVFGYFKAAALTHQLGLDHGQSTTPWYLSHSATPDSSYHLDNDDCPLFKAQLGKPFWHLAGGRLNFVDRVHICRSGGKAGLGYAYGERTIDPSDWFFRFHFHQDPVMPGSLGVEAIMELLSAFALDAGLGQDFVNPRFNHCLSSIKWKYRGQISPLNRQMSLELHVSAIDRAADRITVTADAWLAKDGLRIYQITDLALVIEEA